ncbi:transferase family protein [Aspergillus ibericus CBS 121593]|uniref:Transferase family protein n=1 Tax=Aspergillus ibericus CBS 121593 TaxID=1448316 RepID=A0A395GP80_9EURO|nr:transferase family protein [Aspergillus ibericus CBS 121593]RAK97279.1 transferase family protein [Aspergillus ibericus CBS 121593]
MAHTQDLLGQLPILQSYTHLLLCFPLPTPSTILSTLEDAIQQLFTLIPILAGQVINEDVSATSSGTFTVLPMSPRPSPIIRIVDHTSNPSVPSYSSLRQAHFPSHMLPGALFSPPRPAFPIPYPEDTDPIPVLDLQANLLHGGLLLTLAAQHNIIDASGIFQVASLLARLTRGESIPTAEIHEANRDRRNLISLYADHEPLCDDYTNYKPPTIPRAPPNLTALFPTFQWANFHFPQRSVQAIYTLAAQSPSDSHHGETVNITPNDALTAFIWQRLTHVRLQHSSIPPIPTTTIAIAPPPISKLTRALDLRRTLHLTPAYLGHTIRTATLRLPMTDIATLPLSGLADRLRSQVLALRTPDAVRDYATFLSREPDKRKIAYAGGEFNPRTDFSCSSVAHVDLARLGLGMGMGGKKKGEVVARCEGVRRPEAGVLPGGCYLAAAGRWYGNGTGADGEEEEERGVEALICLDGWEMEGLKAEEEWKKWVEFVG